MGGQRPVYFANKTKRKNLSVDIFTQTCCIDDLRKAKKKIIPPKCIMFAVIELGQPKCFSNLLIVYVDFI